MGERSAASPPASVPSERQFMLDSARALLEGMRRTQQSNSYYDTKLLETPPELPVANSPSNPVEVANPLLSSSASGGANAEQTLQDFMSENPADVEDRLQVAQHDNAPGGQDLNTEGISRHWEGGNRPSTDNDEPTADNTGDSLPDVDSILQSRPPADAQRPNHETRPGAEDESAIESKPSEDGQSWDDLFSPGRPSASGREVPNTCDGIGPGQCAPPFGMEFVETRSAEQIAKELWRPENSTRSVLLLLLIQNEKIRMRFLNGHKRKIVFAFIAKEIGGTSSS